VDASGFKPSKASSFYTKSLKPRRVKRYVKCTLAVGLGSQLVCGFKAGRLARHDVVDFKPVLEKASPIPGVVVVADKGYNVESSRGMCRRSWWATRSFLQGMWVFRCEGLEGCIGRR